MLKDVGLMGNGFVFRLALETTEHIDTLHKLDLYLWKNDVKMLSEHGYNISKACLAVGDLDERVWLKHPHQQKGTAMTNEEVALFKTQTLRTFRGVEEILLCLSKSTFL